MYVPPPKPPTSYGTLPLPCAESGNLRSSFLLNYEGCTAMVMVAATFDGTEDEDDGDNDDVEHNVKDDLIVDSPPSRAA